MNLPEWESENHITDDLDALLAVLPSDIQAALTERKQWDELLEVILDLGRVPTARYTNGEIVLRSTEVVRAEILHVVDRMGDIDADNRAGIARTLHRISAIRNRTGDAVGLTCRVGRAVYGTIAIIQDIIESGNSTLLLGRPGVGKTTMLREAARVLAEKKRVIVVDTSNEIGGDGDIPHPAVGRARRMQVGMPSLQHEVMIEAVENHNPEVIIIDEIGRELEAMAARTIAERGVQLIATAHGNTLDNLLLNPTLSDLVGGIESVTLSDEEARRRRTQKTILERRAPPTFDVLIEIQDRQRLLIHQDVTQSVDALLRGQAMHTELRYRDVNGLVQKETTCGPATLGRQETEFEANRATATAALSPNIKSRTPLKVFPYGLSRDRLERAAHRIRVPVHIVKNLGEADLLITTKAFYRKRARIIIDAERRGTPTYVLRANSVSQMETALSDIFDLESERSETLEPALQETQDAIQQVLAGVAMVELLAQDAAVRRRQHEMARSAHLASSSTGREPNRRICIFRELPDRR
ncbi:MAG: AAA family ATPase [Anaerolineae bacterium]|nr:AAA family ATPase [Anaerolineae bacterium]